MLIQLDSSYSANSTAAEAKTGANNMEVQDNGTIIIMIITIIYE
jgi:hypothetical protein